MRVEAKYKEVFRPIEITITIENNNDLTDFIYFIEEMQDSDVEVCSTLAMNIRSVMRNLGCC